MERLGKVSVWIGNFKNELVVHDYMKEVYDEVGDCTSSFMIEFDIDYIDSQFQEVDFNELDNNILEKFKGFSYVETFINEIPQNLSYFNTIICLYNFEYEMKTLSKSNIKFIGCFNYMAEE